MTKDQKQVAKSLALFVGFKIALYVSIYYAAKAARKATDRYAAHQPN